MKQFLNIPRCHGLTSAVWVERRVVTVSFDKLLLLLLIESSNEQEIHVVGWDRLLPPGSPHASASNA